ncbi:MAG: glycosyltransferase [Candidatus Omnitrophica bacterium]|nr:glycosyltransferase [Candidatus Omnitrophota bacterium]MDD5238470.1 glycosyltransferase [Candidatus Omnitrophota bacterium]
MSAAAGFLSGEKIILASYTHLYNGLPTTIAGPGLALCNYLKNRAKKLVCIWQPMPLSDTLSVRAEVFNKQQLVEVKILPVLDWPFGRGKAISLIYLLLKIRDIFSVIYFALLSRERFDIFVGVEALNASVGVFLARIGLIDKVIYFNFDYGAQRFTNPLFNFIFHLLDKFAVCHSDYTWCLSQAIIDTRNKKGLPKEKISSQSVVPVGVDFRSIKRLPLEEISRNTIVYLGHLAEHQGINLIMEAMPDILKAVPSVKLIIIGSGPLEKKVKSWIAGCRLEEHVEFKGLISDKEVEGVLCKSALGLAPYMDDSSSNKRFTEPTKPKTYASCGLPIIITDVPPNAAQIQENGAGIVIGYNKNDLTAAVKSLLTNEQLYNEYRKNAIEFASRYDWNNIFDRAFVSLFSLDTGGG